MVECLKRNRDLSLVRPGKVFVTVGAGSIPSTIIKAWDYELFKEYHAYDIDEEAVELGVQVLNALAIPGQYQLENGMNINFQEADIIFIANLVKDKERVLEQCYLTAPDHAQIVLRLSSDPNLGLDAFSKEDIDQKKWVIKEIGESSQEFSSFNIFLEKIS